MKYSKYKTHLTGIAQLAAIATIAAGLKLFYSNATVNDLRWILAPTTFFVELVTGERFQFEAYAGYMSADHTFLIAAVCSGVNFFITAFLMLGVVKLWRNGFRLRKWRFIPLSLLIAYLTTIIANTFRISTSLLLRGIDSESIGLDAGQLHRVEGIYIYFGFLFLLFILSERVKYAAQTNILRRSCLPLLIYWATTLGIPFANGAYSQGTAFWEHALFVILAPLLLLLPLAAFHYLSSALSFVVLSPTATDIKAQGEAKRNPGSA